MEGQLIVITPEQATEILRSYGMKTSAVNLREALKQKVFPFGDCIQTPNGSPRFFVYKKLLDDWIKERLVKEESAC